MINELIGIYIVIAVFFFSYELHGDFIAGRCPNSATLLTAIAINIAIGLFWPILVVLLAIKSLEKQ